MTLTPQLSRAARALLQVDQKDAAERAGIGLSTLRAFEAVRSADGQPARRLTRQNERALVEFYEREGVEFIPENGGGEGVRFRHRRDGTRGEH